MPDVIFGTDTATAISNRIVLPQITDQVYGRIALFFRLNARNKRRFAGGLHVEAPFIDSVWGNVNEYMGYDLLDITPQDNVLNGAWDIKQLDTAISLSGRDLVRCNSVDAIADLITLQVRQARMGLANVMGQRVYGSSVTFTKRITGLLDAVDDGSVAANYAGLSRASHTYLNSVIDTTTGTLTIAAIQSILGRTAKGGHTCSVILSRQEQYNRAHALGVTNQRYVQTAAGNSQMLNAGFSEILVCNVPWIVDDMVTDGDVNSSNSIILFLNEEYIDLATFGSTDFMLTPFVVPNNQDAMTQHLRWYGELMVLGPQLCGKMTHVTA